LFVHHRYRIFILLLFFFCGAWPRFLTVASPISFFQPCPTRFRLPVLYLYQICRISVNSIVQSSSRLSCGPSSSKTSCMFWGIRDSSIFTTSSARCGLFICKIFEYYSTIKFVSLFIVSNSTHSLANVETYFFLNIFFSVGSIIPTAFRERLHISLAKRAVL